MTSINYEQAEQELERYGKLSDETTAWVCREARRVISVVQTNHKQAIAGAEDDIQYTATCCNTLERLSQRVAVFYGWPAMPLERDRKIRAAVHMIGCLARLICMLQLPRIDPLQLPHWSKPNGLLEAKVWIQDHVQPDWWYQRKRDSVRQLLQQAYGEIVVANLSRETDSEAWRAQGDPVTGKFDHSAGE